MILNSKNPRNFQGLSGRACKVMLGLICYSDSEAKTFVSRSTLADTLGLGKSAVGEALKQLKDVGLVSSAVRSGKIYWRRIYLKEFER